MQEATQQSQGMNSNMDESQTERSQTPKATCCMIAFIWHSGRDKTVGTENRAVAAGALGYKKGLTSRVAQGNSGGDGIVL